MPQHNPTVRKQDTEQSLTHPKQKKGHPSLSCIDIDTECQSDTGPRDINKTGQSDASFQVCLWWSKHPAFNLTSFCSIIAFLYTRYIVSIGCLFDCQNPYYILGYYWVRLFTEKGSIKAYIVGKLGTWNSSHYHTASKLCIMLQCFMSSIRNIWCIMLLCMGFPSFRGDVWRRATGWSSYLPWVVYLVHEGQGIVSLHTRTRNFSMVNPVFVWFASICRISLRGMIFRGKRV